MRSIVYLLTSIFIMNVPFSQADHVTECAGSDQACVNHLMISTMNENASQTDSAILLVLGLGGLAYWALSRDKNEEKAAEFRSYEISSGKGIRLNSFHSKLRVSAFPNPAQSKSALNALEEFQEKNPILYSPTGQILQVSYDF